LYNKLLFGNDISERRDIMNKKLIFIVFMLCIISTASGYMAGRNYIDKNRIELKDKESEIPVSFLSDKITPSTKMVYQYYYINDGIIKTAEDVPPYFMVGLSLEEVVNFYTNWEIVKFSPKEVIMKKTVYGDDIQKYIISEKGGYIAVFYEENGVKSSIKEITNIKTDGLSHEELEKIKNGINVTGDYTLNRVLENYSC